jgi:hypothetical protein
LRASGAILSAGALVALAACTDPENTWRIATAAGYRDVEVTGPEWFACEWYYNFSTGFTAISG